MTTSEKTTAPDTLVARNLASATRYYLGNRWTLLLMTIVIVVGGLALNWSWLVAAGMAPLLLTMLPCLVMCGFGLCAHKTGSRSGASQPSQSAAGAPSCCGADANVAADQPPKQR